jgi:hypothetical protein
MRSLVVTAVVFGLVACSATVRTVGLPVTYVELHVRTGGVLPERVEPDDIRHLVQIRGERGSGVGAVVLPAGATGASCVEVLGAWAMSVRSPGGEAVQVLTAGDVPKRAGGSSSLVPVWVDIAEDGTATAGYGEPWWAVDEHRCE